MDENSLNNNILENVMNANTLLDIGMDQKKILICFQETIKELLCLREITDELRLQLQQANNLQRGFKKETENLKSNLDFFSSEANFVKFSSDSSQLNDQVKSLKQTIESLKDENQNLKSFIKNQEIEMEKLKCHLLNKIERRDKAISILKETTTCAKKDKYVQYIHDLDPKIQKFGEQQKARALICRIISDKFSQINNSISKLYITLTGNVNNQLHSLILSVIFAIRWKNIKKKNIPIDHCGLMVFTSNQLSTLDSRIDTIYKIFKSLSTELVQAKEKIHQSIQNTQKVSHNFRAVENELNLNKDKYQHFHKQIKFYKSKIADMNEEMSSLISKEKFEEVLNHYSSIEIENDKLKTEVTNLEQIIKEKNNELNEFRKLCIDAEIQHEIDATQKKEDQDQIVSQKCEIEVLNARLKNRSKDLLSIERMSSNVNKTFFIRQNPIYSCKDNEIEPDFSKKDINPKFLTKINV